MDEFSYDSWGHLYQDFDTAWQDEENVADDLPLPQYEGTNSDTELFTDDEVRFWGGCEWEQPGTRRRRTSPLLRPSRLQPRPGG